MPDLHFTIPGEPQGKARHRTAPLYGRDGKPVMKNGHVILRQYTPKKTEEYEKLIALKFLEASGKRLVLECPVELGVVAHYAVAKSNTKKVREEKLSGRMPVTKKPDGSNVMKAVEDGLNGVAYKDDAQISRAVIVKKWSEAPRVEVWLRWEEK